MYYCQRCGKKVYEKFGSGRFCSRSCANTRIVTNETKNKISSTLKRTHPKTKFYLPSTKYLNILALQDSACIELGRFNKGKPVIVKPNEKGCLICVSHSMNKDGYIRYRYNNKNTDLHRVIWILNKGEIPEGYVIRHKCDTSSCCNIDHLELGTQQENVNDMYERGLR